MAMIREEQKQQRVSLPSTTMPFTTMPFTTMPFLSNVPSFATTATLAPTRDAFNNHYVRIVHVNGIHHIALATCSCHGTEEVHADLGYANLILATFSCYCTMFTTSVLHDFRLSNLECKVSAYQYFAKLRRQTFPMNPDKCPNLYQELLRMSRLWRWIKKRKWAGHGHDQGRTETTAGELAVFCPACPQPGINVSLNWMDDPNKWVYRRFFVADGNFKADHVRQNTTCNVWLSNGSGMMPNREEYKAFLMTALERTTVGEILRRRHNTNRR